MATVEQLMVATGWTSQHVIEVEGDLVSRGLAKYRTTGPTIALTTRGISITESALLINGTGEDKAAVRRRQASRLALLAAVYEATGAKEKEFVALSGVGALAAITGRDDLHEVSAWLVDHDLLKSIGELVSITDSGIDLLDRGRRNPTPAATPGVAAMNVLIVNNSPGTVVQQGSDAAIQIVLGNLGSIEQIRDWLADVRSRLEELELTDDARDDIVLTIEAAEAQVQRGKVSRLLRAALTDLRAFLVGLGANVAAHDLIRGFPGGGAG
jgi:hypothetical protein